MAEDVFNEDGRVFAGTWVKWETRRREDPSRIGQVVAFVPKHTDGKKGIPTGTLRSHVAFDCPYSDFDRYLMAVPTPNGTVYYAPQAGIIEDAARARRDLD